MPGVYLESRFNFETPRLEQWLRDVLGVLIAPCPFAQAGGAKVLIGSKLELSNYLLKFGNSRGDGPNRFRLAPIRIATSFRHNESVLFVVEDMSCV
jgi:hypothetical protein